MRIEIEGLILKSDSNCIMLAEKKVIQSGKNIGQEIETTIGNYTSLKSALKGIKRHKIQMSDATTLEELLIESVRFSDKIDELCRKVGLE